MNSANLKHQQPLIIFVATSVYSYWSSIIKGLLTVATNDKGLLIRTTPSSNQTRQWKIHNWWFSQLETFIFFYGDFPPGHVWLSEGIHIIDDRLLLICIYIHILYIYTYICTYIYTYIHMGVFWKWEITKSAWVSTLSHGRMVWMMWGYQVLASGSTAAFTSLPPVQALLLWILPAWAPKGLGDRSTCILPLGNNHR